jgi:Dolichyl-phosphate-mannose-protein mannosyltransferase
MNKNVLLLVLIVLGAALLRLFQFADFSGGTIRFAGTCGQLFDEVKPLVESKNLLNFEVFFYPPVAPLIVASTALVIQAVAPGVFDLEPYCLFLTIAFSLGTLIVIYFIGKEWEPSVGLAAAAFYAVTMISVSSCKNVQVFSTFFSLLAIYFFYRSLRNPSTLRLSLIGIFLGLAVGSKYFPILLGAILFLIPLAVDRKSSVDEAGVAIRNVPKQSGHPFVRVAWAGALYVLFLVTISVMYLGIFHRESAMGVFKTVYDGYPHEHPFEYHLSTINRLYQLGLLATGGAVLMSGLGIALPIIAKLSPWEWFKGFYSRNRFWTIPLSSLAATILITLGIPVGANLNNYLRFTSWLARDYASTDGGMFPLGNPAPSYFFSYFPESLGLPLFILGCLGILYCLYVRDRKAILLLTIMLPLYIVLELSSVKVNRFALDLMPPFCILSGIMLVRLWKGKPPVICKALSLGVFFVVFAYSAVYSLAWANFQRPERNIPVETAEWVNAHVPQGSRIGTKAEFWLKGSPGFLPDPQMLKGYQITDYASSPEYILLPKLVYEIVRQYADLTKSGYIYRVEDWSPQLPPSPAEKAVLLGMIEQNQYKLIQEFQKVPSIFGVRFGLQGFGGRTWFLEHAGAYGIQIYRKTISPNTHSFSESETQ